MNVSTGSTATNQLQLNMKSKITSFAQDKFQKIIHLDGIDIDQINNSLDLTLNRKMMFKAGEGAGSSGSFFFFSHDQRFLIKTMNSEEKKKMLEMLDAYIDHITATNNESLLARIYGIFSVSTNYFATVNIMIMENTCLKVRRKTQ